MEMLGTSLLVVTTRIGWTSYFLSLLLHVIYIMSFFGTLSGNGVPINLTAASALQDSQCGPVSGCIS